jgi:hypothetical protein
VVWAAVWLPGLAVALAAAVATAHGLYQVAVAARVLPAIAWLYPLITDGLALVAYTATARLGGGGARYAWSVVVLAAGLSGLAQASYLAGGADLDTTPALRFGIGAWPAVAAAIVAHLLYLLAVDAPASAPTRQTREGAALGGVVAEGDRDPAASTAVERHPGVRSAVQPAVQPGLYTAVHRPVELYNPILESPPGGSDGEPADTPDRSARDARGDRVEHPLNGADDASPRDRARAAAVRHVVRYGALPTVSELEAVAAVSRGTAAAVLRALRAHPNPLHLPPDNPDPETSQCPPHARPSQSPKPPTPPM